MAILHGKFSLDFIIIFFPCLTSGSLLIKVVRHDNVVLKKSIILNDFSRILGDGQIGSMCGIGNLSCGFQDIKKLLLCEEELRGIGSLNTTCQINTSLQFDNDVVITREGNLEIISHVSVGCPFASCMININISGELFLG